MSCIADIILEYASLVEQRGMLMSPPISNMLLIIMVKVLHIQLTHLTVNMSVLIYNVSQSTSQNVQHFDKNKYKGQKLWRFYDNYQNYQKCMNFVKLGIDPRMYLKQEIFQTIIAHLDHCALEKQVKERLCCFKNLLSFQEFSAIMQGHHHTHGVSQPQKCPCPFWLGSV